MLTETGVEEFIEEWRANVSQSFAKQRGETDASMVSQLQSTLRSLVKDDTDLLNKFRSWIEKYEGNRNPQVWMFRKYLSNLRQVDETTTVYHKPAHELCGICKGMKVISDIYAPYNDRTAEFVWDDDFFPEDWENGEYQPAFPLRMESTSLPCPCKTTNTAMQLDPRLLDFRAKWLEYFTRKNNERPNHDGEHPLDRIKRMKNKMRGFYRGVLTEEAQKEREEPVYYSEGVAVKDIGEDVPDGEMPDCFKDLDVPEKVTSALSKFGKRNSK